MRVTPTSPRNDSTSPLLVHVARPGLIALVLLVADQLSKLAVANRFVPGQSVPVIPGVLQVTYVQNTGMAFGLLQGFPHLFAVLALVVAAWIIIELVRSHRMDRLMEIGMALILGGATGNLIDRVRLGYVIDFLDLRVWPVFNLADSAITIGVGLLLLESFRARKG